MTSSVVDELNEDGKAECWIWVEYVVDAFTDATVTVNIGRSGEDFVANKDVPDTFIVENDAVNLWLSKEETEVNVEDEPTKFDGKKKKRTKHWVMTLDSRGYFTFVFCCLNFGSFT